MEFLPHAHHNEMYTTPVQGNVQCEYGGPYINVQRQVGELLTLDNFLQLGDRPFMFTREQFGELQLQPISFMQLILNNCNGNEWRSAQVASVHALNFLIAIHPDWLTQQMVLNIIRDAKMAIRDLEQCDMRVVRDYCLNEALGDILIMSALICGVRNSPDYQKIAMLQLNYLRAQAVAQFFALDQIAEAEQQNDPVVDEAAEDEGNDI